jgi:diguanylate cyclase (GGDEF)-like protein/PAS domain S-box-containing protein
MNNVLNRLLARQLRKLSLDAEHPPSAPVWSKLLTAIDQTYNDNDQDRYITERSLALSSEEMHQLYLRQKSSYETRVHTIFKTMQDLIWLKDQDGVYLACNQMFERLVGQPEANIIGKTDYDFFVRDVADTFRTKDRLAIQKGEPSLNEEWVTFAGSGYRALLETTKTPMYDETNKLIGVLGMARDITKHRQAEENLRIAATAFEAQEGILITDANNFILRVNRAFTEITGYDLTDVVGKNPRIFNSGRHEPEFYAAMWDSILHVGGWEGEVWNMRKNGEVYPEYLRITVVKDTEGRITHYVATFTDITQNKAAEDEIRYLAYFDSLTRLPNRRLLVDRMRQALASSSRTGHDGALLFLDLDNFKTLNDTLGHDFGDLLLQQVARRLESCVRQGDTVARLGGDEFVVMLEDLSGHSVEAAAQVETVAEKVLVELNKPYQLNTTEYRCTSSIGVTLFNNNSGQSIEELMKQADIAMYQSKNAGRNTVRFFDQHMQDAINERASLEDSLRNALINNEFVLHYQIQVDHMNSPLGAEVLIRWMHPEKGMILPEEFIPAAEETGLILPIGQWVLETACAQLKVWQDNNMTSEFVLAVNVSAKQFRQPHFAASVRNTVLRYDIDPTLLKLELTESMLQVDIEAVISMMNELKAIGIQFSLDDFGTGYSSLQYLKKLPLDQLKIDQSFVRDIDMNSSDEAIVGTIIAVAKSLNLDVIAEGVETETQFERLLWAHCPHFQGYLFGKPMPLLEFERSLEQTFHCPIEQSNPSKMVN